MLTDSQAFSGFAVPDIDAAQHFYQDVLGLRVERNDRMGGLLTLHLGGTTRAIVYPKPDHRPATFTVLNFPVADVGAAVRELSGRGVVFERYDGMPQDEDGVMRGHGPASPGSPTPPATSSRCSARIDDRRSTDRGVLFLQ